MLLSQNGLGWKYKTFKDLWDPDAIISKWRKVAYLITKPDPANPKHMLSEVKVV